MTLLLWTLQMMVNRGYQQMDMHSIAHVELLDGNRIPQLGLGVWKLDDRDAERVVGEALELGYRHIDTATIYRNEAAVGRAIAASDVRRDELFVTTKLWNDAHQDPHGAFEASLDRLGLEKVDLYLMHWPLPLDGTAVAAWRGLVEIVATDRCDSIGVSNFEIEHLEQLLRETGVVPAVNQIELHPLHQRRELREYCAARGIAVEAWSPLGRGTSEILDHSVVKDVAATHNRSAAQTVLRWHVQHGTIVIPKTSQRQRLVENAEVFDFELSAEEMAAIDSLDEQKRFGADPYTVSANQ